MHSLNTHTNFFYRREAMRQTVVGDTNNKEKSKKGKQLLCAKKHQKKKKKKILYSGYNDGKLYHHVRLFVNTFNRCCMNGKVSPIYRACISS